MLGTIDLFRAYFSKISKGSLSTFCEIETAEDDHTLVAEDGSLATVIWLWGSFSVVGDAELNRIISVMTEKLSADLSREGHALQFWFQRDPEASKAMVQRSLAGAETAARQMGLDIEDIMEERKRFLPRWLAGEDAAIVIWTRPTLLSKPELKAAGDLSVAQHGELPGPAIMAQDPLRAFGALRARHESLVVRLHGALKSLGIYGEVLEKHDALVAMRDSVLVDRRGSGWRPMLPGDRLRPRMPENPANQDLSDVLWPPINHQLFPVDAEDDVIDPETGKVDPHMVIIGERAYAGAQMTLGPEVERSFQALINAFNGIDSSLPWRASFLIEGGGVSGMAVKRFFSMLLALTNSTNKQLRAAIDEADLKRLNGRTIVRMRTSFATWAPKNRIDLLKSRVKTMMSVIEGWGSCGVSDVAGDALEGVMSSALGLNCRSVAPSGAPCLNEMMVMLPFGRPTSVWKEGGMLLRSPDGRPFPVQPGSSKQIAHISAIMAPTGSGKSVFLNADNLATVLSPQMRDDADLPLIGTIDIGTSGAGFISLVREALPEHRRDEVLHVRIQNTENYAINPFDTQLGQRRPLPLEKSFQVNLLTLLSLPPGDDATPYDGVGDLISRSIDVAYENKSERGHPERYVPGLDEHVDEALDDLRADLPSNPTWWEIVDALFLEGKTEAAGLAQRFAVPTLADIVEAAHEPRVAKDFEKITLGGTGEPLLDAFKRKMSAAATEYPLLAGRTRFGIANARIICLDLQDVAPKGSENARRQTAAMYMMARHVIARDMFLHEEHVPLFSEAYRDWHEARIRRLLETVRRLNMDEFHRTNGIQQVRAQVNADAREGRKARLQLCLVSQNLEDFDEEFLEQVTSFWILGVGSQKSVDEICRRWNLSSYVANILSMRLGSPTRAGAPLFVIMRTKLGRIGQFLMNTLGSVELWAYSTSPDDMQIRNRLYRRIGPRKARRVLAHRFPGGSAEDEIEQRKKEAQASGQIINSEMADGIIDNIVKEMVALANEIE